MQLHSLKWKILTGRGEPHLNVFVWWGFLVVLPIFLKLSHLFLRLELSESLGSLV